MPLIRRGLPVADAFIELAADQAIPETGAVILSLERFLAERARLSVRAAPVGVRLKNTEAVGAIAAELCHLALVILEFPKFQDGRAMSQARLLRERHRFAGEIRAVGNVLYDQLAFMHRCGFDSFEIADETQARRFAEAIAAISLVYQPAADERETAAQSRARKEERADAPRECAAPCYAAILAY